MHSPRNDTSNITQLQRATHLIILQHGLLGSKTDFTRFMEIFEAHFDDLLYLHASESNAAGFFQTYDGVDQGGERLADEVQALTRQMPHVKKFSMIGHSLGGLYNRYCIGVLLSRGFFAKIEPMNFVTLATPHLGIRRPRRGATNAIFNALMQNLFSRTGAQLMLKDVAKEKTEVLSHALKEYRDNDFYPAWSNQSGSLLVSLPGLQKQHDDTQRAFELFDCVLTGRKLQVFDSKKVKTDENNLKLEIDLSCTEVQILLPRGKSTGDDAKVFGERGQTNEESGTSNESGNFDIQIRWPSLATQAAETHLCVLRIPDDKLYHDWKWLVAFCNASFGVRCLTSSGSADVTTQQIRTPSPLLSCMTRGQFMQALQMFKVRTLYSNIFFDLQVPYTCAAVRAFNPYRASASKCEMSSVYTHIAFDSLKSAEKVRDTIPDKVKRLALKLVVPEQAAQPSTLASEDQLHTDHDVESSMASSENTTRTGSRRNFRNACDLRRKSASVSRDIEQRRHLFSRRRGQSAGNAPSYCSAGVRPVPFVDGHVILDQLPDAFRADTEQDELRSMLLSMQSVGWRRIDVLFGGVMAHEHIIAKRANLDKPLGSGIDIVHHVMDTFLL